MKLTSGYAFQLFYWDYVIGVVLASLLWGLTLGTTGGGELSFFRNLQQADGTHFGYALLGGIIFNVANLLLVAAIDIAGMAVAFPVGIGLALVVGVLLNFLITPTGNPLFLFGGVALVVMAIVLNALAYKRRETDRRALSSRGIQISVACGILMGVFYPFVAKATSGERALGPYTVAFIFSLGVAICAIPVNYLFMRRPLTGGYPVSMQGYLSAKPGWHFWGVIGGMIWCTGCTLNFVASHAHIIGPAISYAIGQGATLVSAIWGVFVWHEFAKAPAASRRLLPWMFFCFVTGLGAIAVAPVIGGH
jgi:glucose uptake protein